MIPAGLATICLGTTNHIILYNENQFETYSGAIVDDSACFLFCRAA